MQRTKAITLLFSFLIIGQIQSQTMEQSSLFCYGDFHPETVKGYDYVVIEPSLFSKKDVTLIKSNNKYVLAYISLGEVNEAAAHYNNIKAETLGKNNVWNSHIVNISATQTRAALFALIERHMTIKGFDGLFLDNIDNYTEFGPTPNKITDLLSFLKQIKNRYPNSVIMQNAGLFIADETRPFIDLIAVESVVTDYDFKKKKYQLREKTDFRNRLNRVENIKRMNNIPIILIEYAKGKRLINQVLKSLKKNNMSYFIAEIELKHPPQKKL